MILSRRSFLKVAGLSAVAVVGASMFTGCGAFSTTPIELVAETGSTNDFSAHVAEIGKKKLIVWPGDAKGDYLKGYLPSYLAQKGLKNFEVVKYEYRNTKDANDKDYHYLEVIVKSTATVE